MYGVEARGLCRWGLWWSSPWGHEALAVLGGVDACGLRRWILRLSSLWGRAALTWVALTHEACASGAFGGAPNGAAKPCRGWR
eukprot:6317415-Pyramimonas_sp.AAC.1